MSDLTIGRDRGDTSTRSASDLYRAAWRWHFYAGLLLLPFLFVLAVTGRAFWKELHQATGFFMAIVLVFFFVTGLAWTGVWGKKIVQAWSTFPAEKWDNVPLSDATHADMNHGALKKVPWALEQTPLPASGSKAGADGVPTGTSVNPRQHRGARTADRF